MLMLNFYAAWLGMLMGALAGAGAGLFFRDENCLGGYGSWRRRMVRLGHIAFFGIALVNLSFALTARALGIAGELAVPSLLLVAATGGMPAVCYLSAYRDGFRHLFFLPAGSVIIAVGWFTWRVFTA